MKEQEPPEGLDASDKKNQVNFFGIQTTTDRLLESTIEDINFVADWFYFEWISSNACSSATVKTAVVAVIIVATIMYAIETSDGRLIQPILNLYYPESSYKRTMLILSLLVFLEGVPQIAITVIGERQLVGDGCGTEFASQAFSNLFTSGYAILSRFKQMYECMHDEDEEDMEIVVEPDIEPD